MSLLEVRSVSKSFSGLQVLRQVSFEVRQGEILCLLGPSGGGKTTLLRIIAGLEEPDEGQVLFEGRDLAGIPAHRRGFGLMFQDYALFPHKDVFENVAFGLRMQGLGEEEVKARVREVLEMVGLGGFEQRDVHSLSGGEQQRVALARSLAPRPRLLMLDEPLGSLDRILREQLMNELRGLLKRLGLTSIYVTHDQEEAFAVADRVVILNRGRVVQIGAPDEVYRFPANAFVARFLGLTNLLSGRVSALRPLKVKTTWGTFLTEGGMASVRLGQEVLLLLRPEASLLAPDSEAPDQVNVVEGVLVERSFRGRYTRIVVRDEARQPGELAFEVEAPLLPLGSRVRLALPPASVLVLMPEPEPI